MTNQHVPDRRGVIIRWGSSPRNQVAIVDEEQGEFAFMQNYPRLSKSVQGKKVWPLCKTHCCDCGVGTKAIGEYPYNVTDRLWRQAWRGRRKRWHRIRGQQVLCIGCLEQRIGRQLLPSDFVNPSGHLNGSARIRDRLRRSG